MMETQPLVSSSNGSNGGDANGSSVASHGALGLYSGSRGKMNGSPIEAMLPALAVEGNGSASHAEVCSAVSTGCLLVH